MIWEPLNTLESTQVGWVWVGLKIDNLNQRISSIHLLKKYFYWERSQDKRKWYYTYLVWSVAHVLTWGLFVFFFSFYIFSFICCYGWRQWKSNMRTHMIKMMFCHSNSCLCSGYIVLLHNIVSIWSHSNERLQSIDILLGLFSTVSNSCKI